MCGFVAYITQNKDQVSQQTLNECLKQVIHRGPDSFGVYTEGLVGFGHNRLSIFDTSAAGHQPMEREDCVLIFNGAIYNFRELRARLTEFSFTSESDSEVLLAAYKKWGVDCVKKFNGQWSFLLYDKSKNIVFGSRDRYGIKPFYYLEKDDVIWFSSEIKALTNTGVQLTENQSAALDFLQHGIHNHGEETFFDEVLSLEPGSNFVYDLHDHSYAIESYYSPEIELNDFSFEENIDRFNALFFDSLKFRLRSDVPLGVSLSGGLDSASIACGLNHVGNNPISVSAVYSNKEYSEEDLIDTTANHAGISNIKTIVEESHILDDLETVIWHHDQPIGSMSVMAQYYNFKQAKREQIKVMLGGQGADETLMGYDAFLKVNIQHSKNPFQLLKGVINLALNNPTLISNSLRKPQISKSLLKKRSGFEFPKATGAKELSLQLLRKTVLPALLHYEDRNAMAHGIESRVPYLDHNLVDFILSVPERFLIKNGVRKFLQRESLKDILPERIYNDRDKKPFISPQSYWMEKNKPQYLEIAKSLSDQIEQVVEIDELDKIGSTQLFRVIAYGTWRKVFFS